MSTSDPLESQHKRQRTADDEPALGREDDQDEYDALFGHVGVMRHALRFVGDKQHLYVAMVCRGWHGAYKAIFRWTWPTTSYAEAFTSLSRLELACENGLLDKLSAVEEVPPCAGLHGTIETLTRAEELGMPLNDGVLYGAAHSGRIDIARWLLHDKGVKSTATFIVRAAGAGGSIEMIKWLSSEGLEDNDAALKTAAVYNHRGLMLHLRSIGTPWRAEIAYIAARDGDLKLLQWLVQHGCPVVRDPEEHEESRTAIDLASSAVQGCNLAMIKWLGTEHSINFDEHDLTLAAGWSTLEVMQHLLSQGCTLTAGTCAAAAYSESTHILEWLHSEGLLMLSPQLCNNAVKKERLDIRNLKWLREKAQCPWEPLSVAASAFAHARQGQVALLQYIHDEESLTPDELSELLAFSGFRAENLDAMKWLKAQGAIWPAELSHTDTDGRLEVWHADVVAWARSEGCTAPEHAEQDSDNTDAASD